MRRLLAFVGMLIIVLALLFSCKKEYSYEKADGVLGDSLGNCLPISFNGYYHRGNDLNPANAYVIVQVNVTKTGAYRIGTEKNNGFQFSDTGYFNQKGIQKVKLKATGTPLRDTITPFTCRFVNSTCGFSIPVKTDSLQSPPIVSDSMPLDTWWFIDSTDKSYHHGIIDHPSTWYDSLGNPNLLNIIGWPATARGHSMDTIFLVDMFFPHPLMETGDYPISSGGLAGVDVFSYVNNTLIQTAPTYSAYPFYKSSEDVNTDFGFQILAVDLVQKTVKGSFTGMSQRRREYSDYVGRIHKVHGMFYARYETH